jgi:predicted nucleotidyltransferase
MNGGGSWPRFTDSTRCAVDTSLRRTLGDALEWLASRGIPCALIGGLAVSFRGQPRLTVDVDLVIRADVADALELARTLSDTPFEPLFADVDEVVTAAFILPLRHRETGIRLDVAVGMSGFEHDVIGRATAVDVCGRSVPVAAVEDLLVMKALAGRPQDEEDIRGLVATCGDTIDWHRCLAVAEALGSAVDIDIAGRLRSARRG